MESNPLSALLNAWAAANRYGLSFSLGELFVIKADRPLDTNEGAGGDRLLEVTLPDDCCDFFLLRIG